MKAGGFYYCDSRGRVFSSLTKSEVIVVRRLAARRHKKFCSRRFCVSQTPLNVTEKLHVKGCRCDGAAWPKGKGGAGLFSVMRKVTKVFPMRF